jgi:hypothetical protein
MPTKAEMAEAIGKLTGSTPDPAAHSGDDLKAMLEKAEAASKRALSLPVADPIESKDVTLRKFNRGSRRRLIMAMENLQKALEVFRNEVDAQAWIADDKGERIGEHPLIAEALEFQGRMGGHINALVSAEPKS